MLEAMDLFIPSKAITKKPSNNTWFDDNCRQAARRRNQLFNQMKKDGPMASTEKFQLSRHDYISAEKIIRINYNRKLKEQLTDINLTSQKPLAKPLLKNGHCLLLILKKEPEAMLDTIKFWPKLILKQVSL